MAGAAAAAATPAVAAAAPAAPGTVGTVAPSAAAGGPFTATGTASGTSAMLSWTAQTDATTYNVYGASMMAINATPTPDAGANPLLGGPPGGPNAGPGMPPGGAPAGASGMPPGAPPNGL